MKLLLTRLVLLSGVLLLMFASAPGTAHGQTPTPVTINVDEDITVDDDGSVPEPVVIDVQEGITVSDGVEVIPGPAPVTIDVTESITVGDDVQVTLGLVPAVIDVHEDIGVNDDSDVQAQDVGPRFLDSVGFFANLLTFGDTIPTIATFTTTYQNEEVVVRIRIDSSTRKVIGGGDFDPHEIMPGLRVMIQTDQPAMIGADVADEDVVTAVEVLIIPDEATRTHRRGVVITDDENQEEGQHSIIDEEGKKRLVEGDLQEGESVVVIVLEKKDGTDETRAAFQEQSVQERLARYEEKLARAAEQDQDSLTDQDREKLEKLRQLKEQAQADVEQKTEKTRENASPEDKAKLDEAKRKAEERERQKSEDASKDGDTSGGDDAAKKAEEDKKKQEEAFKGGDTSSTGDSGTK